MKTTYITSINAIFNPFTHSGAVPRLFLQLLPVKAHKDMKIVQQVLPRSSPAPAKLELSFKDGKIMKWTWGGQQVQQQAQAPGQTERKIGLPDIIEEVNRHARILGRKEELSG